MKSVEAYIIISVWIPMVLCRRVNLSDYLLLQQCQQDEYTLTTNSQCPWHPAPHEQTQMLTGQRSDSQDGQRTQHSDFAPWSYAPFCTDFIPSLGEKLCVYTNTSFSDGRGISIFTTPAIAKTASLLPAFQSSSKLVSNKVNQLTKVWHAEELPGKGIGAVADRKLHRGDRVAAHTPALLINRDAMTVFSNTEREKYIQLAIDQLPPTTRKACYGLATVYGLPELIGQDVLKTNNFAISVGGKSHLALFPEPSRLNHDCGPNAQYIIDAELLTHYVHATRQIGVGDEISITYTPPVELTENRKHNLNEGFLFTCTCSRCKHASRSDATVREIRQIESALNAWSASSPATDLAKQMLQLFLKEGLEGFLDLPYGHLALAHNSVGEAKTAIKYAKLAIESIRMKDGQWTSNLEMWEQLIADPKAHWSWRYRK